MVETLVTKTKDPARGLLTFAPMPDRLPVEEGVQCMTILIRSDAGDLLPPIPDYLTQPREVGVLDLEGKDWQWDGTNVRLIRPRGMSTVLDAFDWLVEQYRRKLVRPVNFGEMVQLAQDTVYGFPTHWQDNAGSGRVLFAGRIFCLHYENSVVREMVPYAWYDDLWRYSALDIKTQLRATDEFACISYQPGSVIPNATLMLRFAPPRKQRIRPRERDRVYPL